MIVEKPKKKKYQKVCDCGGWATEYWRGDIVCKECKRKDQNIAYLIRDQGEGSGNCYKRRNL